MKEWKLALSLAKFELTASPLHLLMLYLVNPLLTFLIVVLVISPQLNDYLQINYVGFDLLFSLIFLLAPAWVRPRGFLVQSINQNSELWAAPTLVLQLQWPITVKTLIKSRLIIYFFLSFPLQCVFLFAIYVIPAKLQEVISPSEYIIFCIIWLAAGVYLGYIMPASDVGDEINVKSVTIAFILLIFGIIAILTFFHLIIGYGLIHSTILLAKNYPVISTISSFVLLIAGLYYWQHYMKKQIHKLDYF
ncbi:MAG TPA: hypothetical protein VK056_04250 [Bacillota bacterium]|nr:hypothetical protein [Bacillota bacterium]